MVDSLLNAGCEVCGCSTCPPGYRVTNDAGVVVLENSLLQPMTCREFEQQGLEGLLSLEICNDQVRLDPGFRQACGCPQPPSLLYQTSAAAPVVSNTPAKATPSVSPVGLTQQPAAKSGNPFLLFQRYPFRSGGIILGALLVAGLYLAFQLRRQSVGDETSTNSNTKPKKRTRTSVESDVAGDETDDIDVDEAMEEESRAVSKKMVYILNDNDSVSEFGSVFSYNIQL